MKLKYILIAALFLLCPFSCSKASAEDVKKTKMIVRKIKIRSADPLLVAKLLAGNSNYNQNPVPSHQK